MTQPRLYTDLAWVWPFLSPPEEYVEEVETIRQVFQAYGLPDGAQVLHLGSGGGSIDFHLKQHYQVTGVDLSPSMLAHAREVNPDVEYVQGDIRSCRLGRQFDGMLVHDAISYMTTLDDLAAAYRTAAAHLAPGGVLVTLPEEITACFRQHRTEVDTREEGARSVTSIIVDYDPDPADHTFEATFVFLIREHGQLSVEVDTHIVGIYDLEDFLAAIRQAGLAPIVTEWELSADDPEIRYPLIAATWP